MQQDALWQAVLGEIELSISRGNFVTWFKNTQIIRYKDDVLVVGVPNIFVKNQLERKFNDLIVGVLAKNGVQPKLVEYRIHAKVSPTTNREEVEVLKNPGNSANSATATQVAPRKTKIADVTHAYRQGLNVRYTFDNFVVGASNELAYAACQAITQNPGTKYNPLFIYGGVGVGKTHLIQAVGNTMLAAKPQSRVIYASTEQIVQEFVD